MAHNEFESPINENNATAATTPGAVEAGAPSEQDVLVVTSKLKSYIRARSGMNTSSAVTDVLSERVRALCDLAIENARAAGRKTVMDRDFS